MSLNVTIIQAKLIWENVEENLKRFTEKIDSIIDKTDLITYLENNGWFYLKTELFKSKSNEVIRERYSFRKSMDRLKEDQDEQVSLLDN